MSLMKPLRPGLEEFGLADASSAANESDLVVIALDHLVQTVNFLLATDKTEGMVKDAPWIQ
jgi:hypothetical protein